jgi:GGDEF domain-containing protein
LTKKTFVPSGKDAETQMLVTVSVFSIEACDVICKRLISAFDQRDPYKEQKFKINLSVGIAIYPDHGVSQFELSTKAEKAMHVSKNNHKHHYTFAK